MTWIKAAFGLIALINWVMSRLDETEKAEALAALWEQEFMKRDKEIRDRAQNLRSAVERDLANGSRGVRAPGDEFSRT